MGIEWRRFKTCTQSMSQTFVLGPFIEALNDSVHHKDFGRCFVENYIPIVFHKLYWNSSRAVFYGRFGEVLTIIISCLFYAPRAERNLHLKNN